MLKFHWEDFQACLALFTLWQLNISIENRRFIGDFPITTHTHTLCSISMLDYSQIKSWNLPQRFHPAPSSALIKLPAFSINSISRVCLVSEKRDRAGVGVATVMAWSTSYRKREGIDKTMAKGLIAGTKNGPTYISRCFSSPVAHAKYMGYNMHLKIEYPRGSCLDSGPIYKRSYYLH